jgi:hypothetical protein
LSADETGLKIRILFDFSTGTGKFSGAGEKKFGSDFGQTGRISNGSLVFFASAETDQESEIRPFELIKFEQKFGPTSAARSGVDTILKTFLDVTVRVE